ncbi:MAG TPA: type VII secretion protein EccE [Actinoplanes sp.]|nr:type VII secretion protein EccE [Actinoplanes sp.]
MTASVASDRRHPSLSGGARARIRPIRRGQIFGIRTGQLVCTQVAAVVLLIGAVYGTVTFAAAAFTCVVLLALTWLRLRGRWAFEWLGVAMRYSGRRHTATLDRTPGALLEYVLPGARIQQTDLAGEPAAVIVDGRGLTAILELGDPAGLLAEERYALPSPAALLPPPGPDHPPCRLQLLLTGMPAPAVGTGNGTPANSYRQLTESRLLGHSRALLAVRVLGAEGWSTEELRRSLSGLVRKIPQRLGNVPARPLGEAAALRVIAELAHDDGLGFAGESWPGLRVGNVAQATYRLRRWPDLRIETSRRLVTRMLSLPAAATTVALTAATPPAELATTASRRAGRAAPASVLPASATEVATGLGGAGVDMTIRLAAPGTAELNTATRALRKLLAMEKAHARRLDGEHLDGFAATLPLGAGPITEMPAAALDGLELILGTGGLMAGRNRNGDPVVTRLFRPEPTRVLLIGGVGGAQVFTLRAMALGARVVVQTTRPQAWEPFVRGAAAPGGSVAMVPPGRAVEIAAGSALHPLMVVVDVGPVGADPHPGRGWQATIVVRDEFGPADVDVASRADLLVLQPLRADEADLVGAAIGLGETAQWLTRIRPDMVGLVNRQAVRWAALAQTPLETQLIGPPGRA